MAVDKTYKNMIIKLQNLRKFRQLQHTAEVQQSRRPYNSVTVNLRQEATVPEEFRIDL